MTLMDGIGDFTTVSYHFFFFYWRVFLLLLTTEKMVFLQSFCDETLDAEGPKLCEIAL